MDYIALAPAAWTLVLIASGTAAAFIGLVLTVVRRIPFVLSVILAAAALVGIVTGGISAHNGLQQSEAAVIDRVEAYYGVTLTTKQLAKLGYPNVEPESGTSQVYGTVTLDAGDGWRQVALAWKNDKMLLVAVDDAGAGQELERR